MSEVSPAQVGIDNHREALSIWLDAFRWVAAVAVLMTHVSHRVLLRYHAVPHGHKSPLFYLVSGLSGFGGPAVITFFVLSGYLVGGGSLRRYRRNGVFDFADYLIARLSRLWTVLVPAFLFTLLINEVGKRVLAGGSLYDLPPDLSWSQLQGVPSFLCNMAFLQTAACQQYGGNNSLWSLFNEFWYYMAWPPVMLALWSRRAPPARLVLLAITVAGLSILAYYQWTGSNIAAYFVIWLMGVVAADRDRPFLPVRLPVAAGLLVAALIAWRITSDGEAPGEQFLKPFLFDIAISFFFANLLLAMKAHPRLPYPPARGVHQPLAGFSFTLYCIHMPLIVFLSALFLRVSGAGWHMEPVGLLPFGMWFLNALCCLAIAWLLSLATERHTPAIRRAMSDLLARSARRSGIDRRTRSRG